MKPKLDYEDILRFEKKGIPLVVLGLPSAGKTTFVKRLLTGDFSETKPTLGVELERYQVYDTTVNIFDLGGHKTFRETLWENYIKLSFAIVFVIDSSDPSSLEDAKEEFWRTISIKDTASDFIILFLCNKADLENTMSLEHIINSMELYKLANVPNASFQFFKVSMKTGENVDSAIHWLRNQLAKIVPKRTITPISFMISTDEGLPIITMNHKDIKNQSFLFSGFLAAIDSFIKKTLNSKGSLELIASENYKLVIYSNDGYIYALIISSDESHEESRRIIEVINNYIKSLKSKDASKIKKYIMKQFRIHEDMYEFEYSTRFNVGH